MSVQASAIKNVSVTGKELYYIRFDGAGVQKFINVGKTTYEDILKMNMQSELPLNVSNEPENKESTEVTGNETKSVDNSKDDKGGRRNGGGDKGK